MTCKAGVSPFNTDFDYSSVDALVSRESLHISRTSITPQAYDAAWAHLFLGWQLVNSIHLTTSLLTLQMEESGSSSVIQQPKFEIPHSPLHSPQAWKISDKIAVCVCTCRSRPIWSHVFWYLEFGSTGNEKRKGKGEIKKKKKRGKS